MSQTTLVRPAGIDDDATRTRAAAHALAAELDARALANERAGTLAPDLVAAARTAGLFRLVTPRSLGVLDLEPAAAIEIVETLCAADGSAGWSILIGNSNAFTAWLDPAVAAE